ncbi:MAG TPA: hypothetical protein VIK83_05845 [Coriobacteriia bacterium]
MHLAPRRTFIALTLAAAALALAACVAPPTDTGVTATTTTGTPVATSSVAPTSTPVEVPAASAGPITSPGTGTALRAAILDAATAGLGVSGNVTVYQLYAQGSAAIGDIQPSTGSRIFFAVTGGPDAWSLAWSAPFGSPQAKLASLQSAAPLVSPELAAKMSWTKKVAVATKAPTLASFKAFALKSAKNMASGTYAGSFTITAKIAKDGSGVWWGNASAQPATDSLDPIGVWGRYSKGKWTGEVADFSTEGADAAFFPGDVLPLIQLP